CRDGTLPIKLYSSHLIFPGGVVEPQGRRAVRKQLQIRVEFTLPLWVFKDRQHVVYRRIDRDTFLDKSHMRCLLLSRSCFSGLPFYLVFLQAYYECQIERSILKAEGILSKQQRRLSGDAAS